MDTKTLEGKRGLKEKTISKDDGIVEEEVEDDMEEEEGGGCDEKKKGVAVMYGKRGTSGGGSGGGGGGGGGGLLPCQVEKCGADLSNAKRYHRRHKVCEVHAKAAAVIVAGLRQRFCQQCSRFHELSEFDESKRSCRRRLAEHNERRRKSIAGESYGEGSSRKGGNITQMKEVQCRQPDERVRYPITLQGNSTYKRSQIK